MLSIFLEILRFIFCCGVEGRSDSYDETYYRIPSQESRSYNFRSSSPSYSYPVYQSYSPTTAQDYYENYTNSSLSNSTRKESKSPVTPSTSSSIQDTILRIVESSKREYFEKLSEKTTEAPQKLKISSPSTLPPYSSKPSQSSTDANLSIIASRTQERFEKLSEKTNEVSQKLKISSPSLPPPNVTQSNFTYSNRNKTVDQKHSQNVSLLSSNPPPSSSKPPQTSSTLPPYSSKPSQSSPLPSTSSSTPSTSLPKPSRSPFKPSPSSPKPPTSSSKPSPLSSKSPSSSKPSPSPSGPPPSSSKPPPSSKPTLSPSPSTLTNQQTKTSYVWVQKNAPPIYVIPKNIEELIKKDIVPEVLNKPLSPSAYKEYFAALLYAEDYYIEKWSNFQLKNVTLELHEAAIYKKSRKNNYFIEKDKKDDKIFVAFEIDSVRERRPFLLSRDFVFARPSGSKVEPFQGFIYRVVKSTLVLVEFGEDFDSQHYATRRYDISFSFNRVCLKRAHQAVKDASDPLFRNFLFPDCVIRRILSSSPLVSPNHKLDQEQIATVDQILSFQGAPPYLVEGPLCVTNAKMSVDNSEKLSRTGLVVREAVLQIYLNSRKHRILICAPINKTCDVLMRSLKNEIPESDMFRANAAFREVDGVPIDILSSCLYEGECFACPLLKELRRFRVILSTLMSSFRLHNEGITAGHFTHVFLVDASSATEPETMVALANLADENTKVIVTGSTRNCPGWVRSDIARQNGLRKSYFQRLFESRPYMNLDPRFIKLLGDTERESEDTYSYRSF